MKSKPRHQMTSKIRRRPSPLPHIEARRLPHEQWKSVDGNYCISNMGRWYSIRRKRILAQQENSSGYMRVTTSENRIPKHRLTHIKVIEIFGDCKGNYIPDGAQSLRELGLSIDHLDRNKNNNKQSNLEIVTHRENCKRKFK